jgi:hypothetical protein
MAGNPRVPELSGIQFDGHAALISGRCWAVRMIWRWAGKATLALLCVTGAVLPPVGRTAITVMRVLSEVLAIAGMVLALVIMLAGLAGLAVLAVRTRRRMTARPRPYRVTVISSATPPPKAPIAMIMHTPERENTDGRK